MFFFFSNWITSHSLHVPRHLQQNAPRAVLDLWMGRGGGGCIEKVLFLQGERESHGKHLEFRRAGKTLHHTQLLVNETSKGSDHNFIYVVHIVSMLKRGAQGIEAKPFIKTTQTCRHKASGPVCWCSLLVSPSHWSIRHLPCCRAHSNQNI